MIGSQRIVSLRGTHGSGKSSVVFKILQKYPHYPSPLKDSKGKPEAIIVRLPNSDTVYVVGRYDTACGGCDGIQPYSEIWPRIDHGASTIRHVLFEGALVSSSYGSIGRNSEAYGDKVVFAFLDTPIETCLKRIAQRRAAKGNFEPVNPDNTVGKYNSIERSIAKIRDEFKRQVVIIDHNKPVTGVMKLFGIHLRKEP
jgi:hypothetical protein